MLKHSFAGITQTHTLEHMVITMDGFMENSFWMNRATVRQRFYLFL